MTLLCAIAFVLTSDGTRIHYVERIPVAPKSDLALVFVPGWMMPGAIWKHQLQAFGTTHRVLAVDPRSQGDSTKTTEGNYPARRAEDLRELFVRRDLRRVVLIAATGSVVDVAAYVDKYGTDRIAGLVLVHGVAGADYERDTLSGLLQWAQRFQTDRTTQTESLVRSLFAQQPPPAGEVRALIAEALKMPTSAALAAFLGSVTSDFRSALPRIDKPALLVVGESRWHDQYVAMQKAIPGAQLRMVPGTGHAPYLEAAPAFNAILEEFLAMVLESPCHDETDERQRDAEESRPSH